MASLRKRAGEGVKTSSLSMKTKEKIEEVQEEEKPLSSVKAWVKYIIYPKDNKGDGVLFYVLKGSDPLTKKTFTLVGNSLRIQVGDYLEFKGQWRVDKKGKDEFCFEFAQRVESDEFGCASLLAFLFGPKKAQKIINYYDSPMIAFDTFKNLKNTFEVDMREVKGIGPKILQKAYIKYETNIEVKELYEKFFKYGLSFANALKVFKKWGSTAMRRIDNNVYSLLSLDGFTFESVDSIATRYYHIDKTDHRRIRAVLTYLLRLNQTMRGNCYMELEGSRGLIEEAQKTLDIPSTDIRECVIDLKKQSVIQTEIVGMSTVCFLKGTYEAEETVAQIISSLVKPNYNINPKKVDEMISDYEELKGFKLADAQKEAIKKSTVNQLSIISGPPGSGKTTIVDAICTIFKTFKKSTKIRLTAPTGMAAKRMIESTGMEACTIHRLLGYTPEGFKYNEDNPLRDIDVLIVDEFSMCDLMLTHRLMLAIPMNTVVIFVGDECQLPSVDCGQVLTDLLNVNYVPKTILNEIYRQQKGSTVLQKALDFNNEIVPDLDDTNDFHFIEVDKEQDVVDSVLNTYLDEVEKYGIENVCLLIPQNVGIFGTVRFNELIQETVNPLQELNEEIKLSKHKKFRLKDRVIQTKNMAEEDIYNGMKGEITEVDTLNGTITVDYGNGISYIYDRAEMQMLDLAYSVTVHKSQGSEFKSVIMLMDKRQSFMNRKRLVYTGLTRTKTEIHIIGQKDMFKHSLKNKDKERLTRLKERFFEYEPIYA